MKVKSPGITTVACCALAALVLAGPARAVDVVLLWTSPGDDGYTGTASVYDIRYAKFPLSDVNFGQGTRVLGLSAPRVAGSLDMCTVKGLDPNADYWFALKTADERGNWSGISNIAVHTGSKVTVELPPVTLSFSGPWPNPVREQARFALSMPQRASIRIDAFDVTGRRVAIVAEGEQPAGIAEVAWNLHDFGGRHVEPGLYLIHAQLGIASFTRRVVVTR